MSVIALHSLEPFWTEPEVDVSQKKVLAAFNMISFGLTFTCFYIHQKSSQKGPK